MLCFGLVEFSERTRSVITHHDNPVSPRTSVVINGVMTNIISLARLSDSWVSRST